MKKILFVDHEKENHGALSEMFPRDKYKVIFAADGIEGLNKFKNEDFDLVVVEFDVKKIEIAKFYRELKEQRTSRKKDMLPVIFIGHADLINYRKNEFEKFEILTKPFEADDVLTKVSGLFEPKTVKQTKSLEVDEVLFFEGDSGDCIYYVVSGLLATYKNEAQVGTIQPGELVGEMSFINNDKRSLTVKAQEKSELIIIPGDKILSMVKDQPKWIQMMIENLSRRLKETLKQIP